MNDVATPKATWGGKRPGAGRKPGIAPRRRYALDLIDATMRDELQPMDLRLRAAIYLAGTAAGLPRDEPDADGPETPAGGGS